MAYQCKEPCLPPPTDAAQCSVDTQGPCTHTDTARCVHTCDGVSSKACNPPDSFSHQAKQLCTGPCFVVPLCPMATSAPCAPPCTSLHTEMCTESPSVPCGSVTPQPCSPCSGGGQPCPLATPEACTPPSPPRCGSSCSSSCWDCPGDGRVSYVFPGSTVCLEPSGSVSVKPSAGSTELEDGTIFLASYQPHFV